MSENQRNREQLEMVDSDVETDIDSDVESTEEESTGPPTFCTFLKKERKVKFFFYFFRRTMECRKKHSKEDSLVCG